jgi:hypothetical protein
MKRVLLFVSIVAGISCFTMMAQTKPKLPQPTKTYNVSLTKDQWYSVINGLEAIKSSVKLSNMPANQSTYISDSLITLYQVEFSRQVNLQLNAEKVKPEVKKDSTSKPKKN